MWDSVFRIRSNQLFPLKKLTFSGKSSPGKKNYKKQNTLITISMETKVFQCLKNNLESQLE